jgi:hypothetical protein
MSLHDLRKIGEIIENMQYEDYLLINESMVNFYDWNKFFEHSSMMIGGIGILEEFEKIKSDSPTTHGTEDVFLITLRNGQKFESILNYWTPHNTKDYMSKKDAVVSVKGQPIDVENYSYILNNIQPTEYMVVLQFKDASGRHEVTNNVGPSAHELFISVKDSYMFSMHEHDYNNCFGIIMRINNIEYRRVGLYKMMLNRYMKNKFPRVFEDKVSEEGYTLLIATK